MAGLEMNLVRVDIAVQAGDLPAILRHLEPTQYHRFVDFEMELKGVDVVAVTKRLIRAKSRGGQMDRAVGDIEGVAVPLKERFGFAELVEQRILFSMIRTLDVVPADFFDVVGIDP